MTRRWLGRVAISEPSVSLTKSRGGGGVGRRIEDQARNPLASLDDRVEAARFRRGRSAGCVRFDSEIPLRRRY